MERADAAEGAAWSQWWVGEVDEDGEKKKIRSQIVQDVVPGIKASENSHYTTLASSTDLNHFESTSRRKQEDTSMTFW